MTVKRSKVVGARKKAAPDPKPAKSKAAPKPAPKPAKAEKVKADPKPKTKPKGKKPVKPDPKTPPPVLADVRLTNVTVDPTVQPRVNGLDSGHVDELVEAIHLKAKLPRVVLYDTGEGLVLSEGFHRFEAHKRSGKSHIAAEIRKGTREDAILNAMASNQAVALRRTSADKRRAISETLKLMAKWSDRKVAEHVGVTDKTVADERAKMESGAEIPHLTEREGKDGKTQTSSKPKATPKVTAKPSATFAKPDKADGDSEDSTPTEPSHSDPMMCDGCEGGGCEDCGGTGFVGDGTPTATAPTPEPAKPSAETPHAKPATEPTPEPEPAKTPAVPLDRLGLPIQEHAAEAFEAVPLFEQVASLLRQARSLLTELGDHKGGALLIGRMSWIKGTQKAGGRWSMAELDNALGLIEEYTPYATDCPYLFADKGGPSHTIKCPICAGKRFTPDLRHRQIPAELIDRMKAEYAPEPSEG